MTAKAQLGAVVLVAALTFANLLAAGLLAGEEVAIRYGVRGPVAALAPAAHIRLRQGLIRTLRVLVPALFAAAAASGGALALLAGAGAGLVLRCCGLFALGVFITVTLAGTVPINQAALGWDPDAPPADWLAAVRRWERLDTARTWAAVTALALFVGAALAHPRPPGA